MKTAMDSRKIWIPVCATITTVVVAPQIVIGGVGATRHWRETYVLLVLHIAVVIEVGCLKYVKFRHDKYRELFQHLIHSGTDSCLSKTLCRVQLIN